MTLHRSAIISAAPQPTDAEIDDLCRAMWGGKWWWLPEIEIDPRIPAPMLDEKRNPQRQQMRAFLAAVQVTK